MSCIINWALFIIISLWLGLFSACNWGNANSNTNLWFSCESKWRRGRRNRPDLGKWNEDMKRWDSFWPSVLPQDEHNLPNLCPNLKPRCWHMGSFIILSSKRNYSFTFGKWSEVSSLWSPCASFSPPDPLSSSGLSSVPHWMTSTSFEIH